MRQINNKIKLIVSNILFGICSVFWKKDETVVLFGSWFGTKFADNSRFLFQYLSDEKEKNGLSHVIWVTRNLEVYNLLKDMGYEVFMMDSKESIYWHKKAKYHIVCNKGCDGEGYKGDILGQYSYRAKRINLWHGVAGIKGVSCTSNEYKVAKKMHPLVFSAKEFFFIHSKFFRLFIREAGGWSDSYILTTTPADTDLMQPRYLLPRNNFIESGFPRNCKCIRFSDDEEKILKLVRLNKTVLYLPTFRSSGVSFSASNIAKSISAFLETEDIFWVQKAHTVDKESCFRVGFEGHILSLPPEFDINLLLPHIRLLVTDYSSVASDAMCHNKLVVYYVPDFEEYKKGARGFAVNPEEIMCGPKVYSTDALQYVIRKYIDDPDKGKTSNYSSVRTKYWNDIFDLGEIWTTIVNHVNNK